MQAGCNWCMLIAQLQLYALMLRINKDLHSLHVVLFSVAALVDAAGLFVTISLSAQQPMQPCSALQPQSRKPPLITEGREQSESSNSPQSRQRALLTDCG